MVLIVGDQHPLAGETEIDKEMLAELKFVSLHRSSTVKGIRTSLERHGIDWKSLQVVVVRSPCLHGAQRKKSQEWYACHVMEGDNMRPGRSQRL